jgi:hypothetical protein
VGAAVVTADGHNIGKVVAADPLTLAVEKGLLFKRDYLVPRSAINRYDPNGKGTVYLSLTQDQALTSGREQPPD